MHRSRLFGLRPLYYVGAAILILGYSPPPSAYAYTVETHHRITEITTQMVPDLEVEKLPCPADKDLTRFRQWLDALFRERLTSPMLETFVARYPPDRSLAEPRVLRGFLSQNTEPLFPGTTGIDLAPECTTATPRELLLLGSSAPRLDKRNQNRLYRDAKGALVIDADGDALPTDPGTLNMGGPTGLDSERHAHFALPRLDAAEAEIACAGCHAPKKTRTNHCPAPETLETNPQLFGWAFAWRGGDVTTIADAQAQLHFDLADIALRWDDPTAPALSWIFLGAALHYVQGATNPMQNLQACYFEFFRNARIKSSWSFLRTIGGVVGKYRDFVDYSRAIMLNHHLAANVAANALFETDPPAGKQPFLGWSPDPLELNPKSQGFEETQKIFASAAVKEEPVATLVSELAAAGAAAGPDICRHISAILRPKFRDGVKTLKSDKVSLQKVFDREAGRALRHLTSATNSYREAAVRAVTAPALLIHYFNGLRYVRNETQEADAARLNMLLARVAQTRLEALRGEDLRRSAYLGTLPNSVEDFDEFRSTNARFFTKREKWRWNQRRALVAILMACLPLGLAGGLLFWRRRRRASPPPD